VLYPDWFEKSVDGGRRDGQEGLNDLFGELAMDLDVARDPERQDGFEPL